MHGPHQTQGSARLAYTKESQGHTAIPGILQLLPSFCARLLHIGMTPI